MSPQTGHPQRWDADEVGPEDSPTGVQALELTRICRSYGRGSARVVALDEVSVQVRPGEFVAVMAPSGSGKSTLLDRRGTGSTHFRSGARDRHRTHRTLP